MGELRKYEDLSNKNFGCLKVLGLNLEESEKQRNTSSKKRVLMWDCQCTVCGNLTVKNRSRLKEIEKNNYSGCKKCHGKQYVGERYGHLLVLENPTKIDSQKSSVLKCLCDCGNICYPNFPDVMSGNTLSCGCMKINASRNKLLKSQQEKVGEEIITKEGYTARIIKYIKSRDIIIEFQDKYKAIVHTTYDRFKIGDISNPYHPSVFGHGFRGQKYNTSNDIGKRAYKIWQAIMQRCFDDKFKKEHPTYKDCVVCEQWLNFENFYEWLINQSNFHMWKNNPCTFDIDKDIIPGKNAKKKYCPENCCLVPERINALLVNKKNFRGEYPIGVSWNKINDYFSSSCCNGVGRVNLGGYSSPIEAYNTYKIFKEQIIKETAEQAFNNNEITIECYNALMKYEVEITD